LIHRFSLATILAMVCRVIPAGCVSVDKGKCFVMKLVGHRGKPDAARRLIRCHAQNDHVQIGREGGATDIHLQIGVANRDYH
jgi:hypothetical protein